MASNFSECVSFLGVFRTKVPFEGWISRKTYHFLQAKEQKTISSLHLKHQDSMTTDQAIACNRLLLF